MFASRASRYWPCLQFLCRFLWDMLDAGSRELTNAWDLSPWWELTPAIIVVDRKGQDGFP